MRSEGRESRRSPRHGGRASRSAPPSPPRRRHRRDRHGRGLRGALAPRGVPLSRTRSESFDDVVLAAVDELDHHWAAELATLEFAVEEVPDETARRADFGTDTVVDRGVVLGRLLREGLRRGDVRIDQPVIVLYRRPIEARALDGEDCADLVFMIVVDLVAEFLGRDIDEIDPP